VKKVLSVSSSETDILSQTEIYVSNGNTVKKSRLSPQENIQKTWRPMISISHVDVKSAVVI